VLAGTIVFPWADRRAALMHYAGLMLRAPDELFGSAVLTLGPGGNPVVAISLIWSGELKDGEAIIRDVAAFGQPLVVKAEPMAANGLLAQTDGKLGYGVGYEVATRWFSNLTPDTIDILLAAFEARTSPLASIILQHCHGAASRVAPEATAFGMREPHFAAMVNATWDPPRVDAQQHRSWVRSVDAELAATSLPGGYANLLPDHATDLIAHAYGPNASKLTRIKARFDPDNVLRAIPLPVPV
jgi:hypothetical protein